jgi:ABC-type transporter Mla subunit MlaD
LFVGVGSGRRQEGGTERHTGRDTLDATTTSETADSRLGDALDVVTEDLAMTLGSTLAEALAAFATYSIC